MHDRRGQRGEGRVGLIVAIAIIAAAVFAASKYLPVRIAAYEFRDYVEQECRNGAWRKNEDEVRQRILEKASDMELPVEKKQLEVKKTRSEMIVRVQYTQPIDFKVTTYDYKFDHEYRAPLF